MISALLLGRKGSKGFPGKNTFPVLGKPLCWYPMSIAKSVTSIDNVYLSTDDPALMDIANSLDVNLITRPPELASDKALGEDAYVHGYGEICKIEKTKPDIVVLMFCNSATITAQSIEKGISLLRDNPDVDSAVTVSRYNMWSPLRARKLNDLGELQPFVQFEYFGDPQTLNCDRDSQGDVLFADMGCSVVRSRCLENLDSGLLPQKWMGNRILPIYQEAAFDVDYEWQIPQLEWWLKKNRIAA